jgi:glycosyltransferase involved in cell wall biosynthesis
MRILQLVEAAATGAGRHVMDLSAGLLARGHEVHLWYSPLRCDQVFVDDIQQLHARPHFHSVPVTIERYPVAADIPAALKLRRYLRTRGPFDLVHCHSTKAGWLGRAGLAGHSVKRLYTPHGFLSMDPVAGPVTTRIAGGLERALAGVGAGVVVVSREEHAHAISIGIPQAKLRLISNGVAPALMGDFPTQRSACRRDWGLEPDEVCIGFVGRFTPVKGPEVMLDSFAAFLRRSRAPARLVMVGDGALALSLRRQGAELGLMDRIVWLGARDARPLMPGFDILALTSRSEGHPLVVLEAMARGLPIVATRVGGIADTLQPGVNGFIAPVGDREAIAGALAELAHDPALRTRMGEASRAVSLHFSSDRMVEQTVAFYQDIASGVFASRAASSLKMAASG